MKTMRPKSYWSASSELCFAHTCSTVSYL